MANIWHAALLQAMTSPSGTLSTIASGTTVSVAESPVGGLSHSTGAFQAEPAQQQVRGAPETECNTSLPATKLVVCTCSILATIIHAPPSVSVERGSAASSLGVVPASALWHASGGQ